MAKTNNIDSSCHSHDRAEEIMDRLIELGWQDPVAEADYFAGVTAVWGDLQIDVVFDDEADYFARISVRRGPRMGENLQSWHDGEVKRVMDTTEDMAAPKFDEAKFDAAEQA